jgi:hypothetical protein
MTSGTLSPGRARITARTLRTDKYWISPLLTVIGITAWITYATVRVFMQDYYWAAQGGDEAIRYLTPFYSPCISNGCIPAAAEWGTFLPDLWFIPYAALTLPFLFLFRFTCYYYRKAYYRSFWQSPPACAVAEPHKKYTGETRFPLIFQNGHRYFFYLGLLLNVILTYDAVLAFRNAEGAWGHVSIGTLVLVANATLLWLYSLSCHSCRHAMGGRLKHFSKHPVRYKSWTIVSKLNVNHGKFAMISLFGVALTDLYVRQVATGAITNFYFF